MREADVRDVNLSGTNLQEAELQEANLRLSILTGADLRWAKYSDETAWPDSFDPEEAGGVLVNDQ